MKIEKLVDLYTALILMCAIMLIVLLVCFIKAAGSYKIKTIIKQDIKDTINEVEEPIIEETPEEQPINNYQTRLTSFYSNDGYGTGSCTGTGLCETDFQVNDKGWYTYQGKLVLATATPYLLIYGYSLGINVETYRYYEELQIIIDGINYNAIVLDSCGACMTDNRIDLFVSNKESVKDTIIEIIK